MKPIIRQPVYIPRIDGKIIPVEDRNVENDPECLGSKYFDLSFSQTGEPIGPCFNCIMWRKCLAKRLKK